jgi:hypothetical protein
MLAVCCDAVVKVRIEMSYASIALAPAPEAGLFARFAEFMERRRINAAAQRRSIAVAHALLRSGDHEMMELGRQIMDGRPLEEVFPGR